MAVVHTVITPTARFTPFTGGTDARRLAQGAARGEVRYLSAAASSWPATGASDNRSLAFSMNLDRDYAWVLTDMSCNFLSTGGSYLKMEAVGFCEVSIPQKGIDQFINFQLVSEPSRQDTSGSTAIGSIQASGYNTQWPILDVTTPGSITFQPYPGSLPKYMLYPFDKQGGTVSVSVVFSESPTQEPAITPRFACRFLQYDIDQAYDWRVQSPSLVR